MKTYRIYTRHLDGTIEWRTGFASTLQLSDIRRPKQYPFEERLTGWPELKVYWLQDTGISSGVAPQEDD